jgi:hypothetical protein
LFVVSAGADWQRDLIRDAAAFAAGPSTRLAIADHDHDHDLARPLRPAAESQRGHRLFSVAALSLHWGSAGAGREMRVGVAARPPHPDRIRPATAHERGQPLALLLGQPSRSDWFCHADLRSRSRLDTGTESEINSSRSPGRCTACRQPGERSWSTH